MLRLVFFTKPDNGIIAALPVGSYASIIVAGAALGSV
jgi:hypothetical protein